MKVPNNMPRQKGFRYPREIIAYVVWAYPRLPLSTADAKLVANMVEDGRTPYLSIDELEKLGFALAIYPVSSLLVVAQRLQETYAAMHKNGRLPESTTRLRFDEYNEMIGLNELVPSAVDN